MGKGGSEERESHQCGFLSSVDNREGINGGGTILLSKVKGKKKSGLVVMQTTHHQSVALACSIRPTKLNRFVRALEFSRIDILKCLRKKKMTCTYRRIQYMFFFLLVGYSCNF